ncbi:MAG TPA: hypothetical protein HA362_07895 [Nanoarchaeota archaeon]|nr:hypothetical protein [Nanoarchaeota archaeon]
MGLMTADAGQKLQRKEEGPKPLTIPEHNILQLLNKMEILEKKMHDTSVFLALYNELRDLETRFVEAVDAAEANNYAISESVKKRIKMRKDKILRKR